MKCTNCGTEFEGVFCPNCGAKSEAATAQINTPVPEAAVSYQAVSSKVVTESNTKNTYAIVSLILGIIGVISLGSWVIPNVLAIVFGVMSRKIDASNKLGTAGFICGIIGTVIGALIWLLIIVALLA